MPPSSARASVGTLHQQQREQRAAAAARVAARQAELQAMSSGAGGPFSFCARDAAVQRAKAERAEAHRKDKDRFQV